MELTLPAPRTRLVLYVYSSYLLTLLLGGGAVVLVVDQAEGLLHVLDELARLLRARAGAGLRQGLGLGLGGREAWREGQRRGQRASEGSGVTRGHTSS